MSRSSGMSLLVGIATGLILLASPLFAESWDVESGFSVSNNPNGVWSYGWSQNLGAGYAFNLLTDARTLTYSPVVGLERRSYSSSSTEPGICHNPTSGTLSNWGVTWPSHTMSLHPGPSGEDCIVRWTAPAAGSYTISGQFFDVTSGATTSDVHVLHNRVSQFDALVQGDQDQPFTLAVDAIAGDTIDFAVGYGSNGNYAGDSTGLSATITGSDGTPARLVVNELQSANSSTVEDEDGDHPDWIEIHNAGGTSANLLNYGLSDDPALPFKWTFPSKTIGPYQYLLIFASDKDRKTGPYLHTNYAIKSGGETIVLTAPDGMTVSQIPATSIPQEISYGRYPDGDTALFFFATPTPGQPNTTTPYSGFLTPPVVSRVRGFYNSGFNLSMTTTVTGGVIHYTTDGSAPVETSPVYSGPIAIAAGAAGTIFKTTVVRSRVMKTGYMPSPVTTNTYFVGPSSASRYNLAIVSLSTDNANFFDPEIGIYVSGNHDNYNQKGDEWERPVHVEFFEPGSSTGFHCDAGVRIQGNWTRNLPQKSLRLYSDNQGGPGSFDYQIFPESTLTDYRRIILRNAGNDNPLDTTWGAKYTFIREALVNRLVHDWDIDTQMYRPAIVFFNGEYWGIFGIEEREDKYWIANHHPDVDPDNLDLVQQVPGSIDVEEGDTVAFDTLRAYFQSNDMTVDSNYDYVKSKMDIHSVLIHHLAHIYGANFDWPRNNLRFWRERTETGKWRWAMADCDFHFGFYYPVSHNTLAYATTRGDWLNADIQCLPMASLLRNEESRNEFINMMADMMNTVYKPSNVLANIESLQSSIAPYLPEHFTRWRAGDMATWNINIQGLRDFANQRPAYIRSQFIKFFRLTGTSALTINVSPSVAGTVSVSSITIPSGSYPWQGDYFDDVPIKLTAAPANGYRFVRWQGGGLDAQNPATISLLSDTAITAVFEVTQ